MQTTQEQEKAILKIAYMLASLDTVLTDAEKKTFRQLAGEFKWFAPGDPTTNEFLDDAIAASEKLLRLRAFYDTDEYLDAFAAETDRECGTIMTSDYASRKAFALWITICMSGQEFTPFLRCAIKKLQIKFVKRVKVKRGIIRHHFGSPLYSGGDTTGKIIGPLWPILLCEWILGIDTDGLDYETVTVPIIPDSFLKDVEKTVALLNELAAKIDATEDPQEKEFFETSYENAGAILQGLIVGQGTDFRR